MRAWSFSCQGSWGVPENILALFKSPSGGRLTKIGSVTFWGPLDTSFLFAQIVGARWPQKTSVFGPQNLAYYAKFWAQNATKTSAGHIPESLSNLFLRDNCRLLQRLLNNAKEFARRGREGNASPGAHSEAPGRSSGAAHQQHPKPESQDSQHMLNQPRPQGVFPWRA